MKVAFFNDARHKKKDAFRVTGSYSEVSRTVFVIQFVSYLKDETTASNQVYSVLSIIIKNR